MPTRTWKDILFFGAAVGVVAFLAFAFILGLTGCRSIHTNPEPIFPTITLAPTSTPPTAPPTTPAPQPSPTFHVKQPGVGHPTPSYPHRAVHAGEYCHGFDKGTYAYGTNGDLLYCGPLDAALPTWHKV